MMPTGGAGANRAGLMRLVIAVLLAILAANAAAEGRYLNATANGCFAILAGMLAYLTLPGRRLPRAAPLAALGLGVALWIASCAAAGA